MGKKSRRARALSEKGRSRVATAEVDTTNPTIKPTITKEPSASVVSKSGESPFNLQKVNLSCAELILLSTHIDVVCSFDCYFLTTVAYTINTLHLASYTIINTECYSYSLTSAVRI